MKIRLVAGMPRALALAVFGSLLAVGTLSAAELTPPKAGKPEILPLAQVKPGMQAIAWTDRKSTRLNSSHSQQSRMPSSA